MRITFDAAQWLETDEEAASEYDCADGGGSHDGIH